MIRLSTTAFLLALSVAAAAQTTHELTNVGTSFSPTVINMVAGDSIHLVLGNQHTCTEVDQATWNANDITSNGGFDYPGGEYTFALDQAGTYYYVCLNHVVNMGMKGQFIVATNTGVQDQVADPVPQLFPNPANKRVTLSGIMPGKQIRVHDMNGRLVLQTTTSTNGAMDISTLEIGTYLVTVRDEDKQPIALERLVITR